MNKKGTPISGVADSKIAHSTKKPKEHLADIAKASVPVALDNIVKSIKGVNSGDLSKKLDIILNNQELMKQIIANQRVLDSKLNQLLARTGPGQSFVIN